MLEHKRYRVFLAGLAVACLALLVLSFTIGYYKIPLGQLPGLLLGGTGSPEAVVLLCIRLPRILAAFLIGSSLAVSGSAFQGMFHNPLAAPDILGVSAGAGLGAAIAISLRLPYYMIQFFAFGLGMAVVGVCYLLSLRVGQSRSISLVLAGVMLGTLCLSGTAMLKYLADPSDTLPAITFWLMGSVSKVSFDSLLFALPPMLLGFAIIFALHWRLNLLTLGDEEAQSLGLNPARVRLLVVLGATLLGASAVCLGGIIGWVGLMIPHIARRLVGPRFGRLLPAAALLGGFFLLCMDNLARSLFTMEIPIGILTAIFGAPFFIWLILGDRSLQP